jgi:HK97 family phage major capsid protein
MKNNPFENTAMDDVTVGGELSHAEIETIFEDAKRGGSLREAVLAHADDYGIQQIDWLFPDAKNVDTVPSFIQRDQGWVSKVMQGTKHTPFSRIKTLFADITEDEARAKGYIKGNKKVNEVFTLLKRTTDPQTIYKKQKLDRDDVIDITDFDVVSWLKAEMRMMLDEEIARAILIGDGRQTSSDDHISESHIRSIFRDDDLYTVRKELVAVQGEPKAKTFIKTVRKAWKDYKGSGNAVAFVTEDWLSELLLLEDGIGHFLYPTKETAANVLGVREIITVPVMADASTVRTDTTSGKTFKPAAIIVNLNDYNVGADKGGSVNMFEDFDIDYNQQKYLIETRCSGALIKPMSAIVIEEEVNP